MKELPSVGRGDQKNYQSIDTVTGASLLFPYISTAARYDLSTLLIDHHLPLSLAQAIDSSQWLAAQSTLFKFDLNIGTVGDNWVGGLEKSKPSLTTLREYQPLNEQMIRHKLPEIVNAQSQFIIKFITESTNADLLSLDIVSREAQPITVAVAEMQQSGRGRRDKHWLSPLAINLYFSLRIEFPLTKIELLQSLSIRGGIILLDILHDMGLEEVKLKWPNDLWYRGRKLAGILVETKITGQGVVAVIGIGLNNHIPINYDFVDQSLSDNMSIEILNNATSCEAILGMPIDRNILVAKLTTLFYQLWQEMNDSKKSLVDIVQLWPEKSYFYGKMITLWQDQNYYNAGLEIGIDRMGALLVQTDQGIERITSSEFSLRGGEAT